MWSVFSVPSYSESMLVLMIGLTYPISALSYSGLCELNVFMGHQFNMKNPPYFFSIAFDWFFLFAFGYLQWFICVPFVYRFFKNLFKDYFLSRNKP